MEIVNNTNDAFVYMITATDLQHGGNLDPGQTADEPDFDDQQNVTVNFYSTTDNETFEVNIPQTGEDMSVTIGIYFE